MASKAIGLLTFNFGANLGGFERAMKKAQKKLKKFGKSIKKVGQNLTTGLTLPIIAFGAVSLKAFDEQQKAIAQVEAGLKSTQGQVGLTSEALQKMASDLQSKTLFGDEQILKEATAQLLTFTNITGVQFEKTQKIALDLATRLDGDLKSSAIMLGKALNDPVANLSALSRAGIQFSTEQKSTIKALVETNQLAEAQNIILQELEKQYGGSAEAAAKAGMGPITQLKNQLSDLSEQIGERLIPYVMQFSEWVVKLAEKFDNLSDSQKDNIVKWGLILAALGPVLIILGQLSIAVSALIPIFVAVGGIVTRTLIPAFVRLFAIMMANPIIAVAAGLTILTAAIYAYVTSNEEAEKSAIQQRLAEEKLNFELEEKKKLLDSIALKESLNTEHAVELKKQELEMQNRLLNAGTKKEKQLIEEEIKLERLRRSLENISKRTHSKIIDGVIVPLTQQEIQKQIEKTSKSIEKQQNKVSKLRKSFSKSKTTTNEVIETNEKLTEQFSKLSDQIIITKEEMMSWEQSPIEDQFKDIVVWQSEATQGQQMLNAGVEMFGDIVMSSMNDAINSQENFFNSFIANIKKAIQQIMIQLAVMTALQVIMGGAGFVGQSGGLTSILSGNLSSILGVKPFAEGGLVSGPQLALIGEGAGTSSSNPEVVAPLDKLKGMIGGGMERIEVVGKLIGNDIYLSNSKTNFNRMRSV